MRFGILNKDKMLENQTEIANMILGVKKFAYLPISLADGRYLWWEYYWAYYRGGKQLDGELFIWSGASDTYCPINTRYEDPSVEHIDFNIKESCGNKYEYRDIPGREVRGILEEYLNSIK